MHRTGAGRPAGGRTAGRTLGAAAIAVSIVAAACQPAPTGILIDGSSTVFPVIQAIAEEFTILGTGVRLSVGISGTGGGFSKFCGGETHLQNASREITGAEAERCRSAGVTYQRLTIGLDGLSLLVHPTNDWARCLTVEEVREIWRPGSPVNNWQEIRAGFPDLPLRLYGPDTDSGTFDYFTEVIVGAEGASRDDYMASVDDNVLVQGISGDPGALGYFGFGYYEENRDRLRLVAVDAGAGCVTPAAETVSDGTYAPLARPLFLYVAKRAAAERDARAFVDFAFETVNSVIRDVGYVPLPEERLAEERRAWEAFAAEPREAA